MRQDLILPPMGALVLLTFIALILIPVRRFRAGFAGQVSAEDFRFGELERVPDAVSIPNRNYMNLLELPVLFYVLCIVQFMTAGVTTTTLVVAWSYVALRVVHSAIHLTYNNVRHRLIPFAASNVLLGAMWVTFFVEFYKRPI